VYNVAPLVIWGLVEQNVVIVAACIPTLRPFFHKTFGSKRSTSDPNTPLSGSAFKLSSRNATRSNKHAGSDSVSELPLDDRKGDYDAESNDSQKGIWRTREVTIDSDEDTESGRAGNVRAKARAKEEIERMTR
jgi:hypothetical protein